MQQLSAGATLQGGNYIIEKGLGQGGFGITYYYDFLYLGEYTHSLANGVPTDANIWTVKE